MIRRLIRLIGVLGLAGAAVASAQYATLTGTLQSANGLPALDDTLSFTINQWGYIGGTGVVVNTTTYCGTDNTTGSVVGIAAPSSPTLNTPSYSGGSMPAGNYYVVFAWYTGTGTITQVSPESTAQLTATGNLQVAPPSSGVPAGAAGMNVYIGTTSGGETLQGQTTGSNVFMQSTTLTAGSNPPSSNNTICKQVANDAIWPIGTGYVVSMTDPSGNTLPGYPMMWQLLGPNTTINLSNGLPYYHGVVTFPSPILASPQNHGQQSISGPLSLGTYFESAGGYQIGGVAPPAGDCLASDGFAYDVPFACSAAQTLYYQTVSEAGTNLPQQPIINFDGTVVASAGTGKTNVGLPSVATPGTCTNCTVTFDAQGRATSYSDGGAGNSALLTGSLAGGTPQSYTIVASVPANTVYQICTAFTVLSVAGGTSGPGSVLEPTATLNWTSAETVNTGQTATPPQFDTGQIVVPTCNQVFAQSGTSITLNFSWTGGGTIVTGNYYAYYSVF